MASQTSSPESQRLFQYRSLRGKLNAAHETRTCPAVSSSRPHAVHTAVFTVQQDLLLYRRVLSAPSLASMSRPLPRELWWQPALQMVVFSLVYNCKVFFFAAVSAHFVVSLWRIRYALSGFCAKVGEDCLGDLHGHQGWLALQSYASCSSQLSFMSQPALEVQPSPQLPLSRACPADPGPFIAGALGCCPARSRLARGKGGT